MAHKSSGAVGDIEVGVVRGTGPQSQIPPSVGANLPQNTTDPALPPSPAPDEGDGSLDTPAQQIYHLLHIRKLPRTDFWKVAEEEWEKLESRFTIRVTSYRKQILDATNQIYLLAGFSGAFQGLLITAAAQGTKNAHLRCKTSWTVLCLSVFVSVVTAAAVQQKVKNIQFLNTIIESEEPTRRALTVRLYRLHRFGPDKFNFEEAKRTEKVPFRDPTRFQKIIDWIWPIYARIIFVCLLIFGFLSAFAIYVNLCR